MLTRFTRIVAFLFLILNHALILAAAPSVEDFFKRSEIASISISQDGRYFAYLTPSTNKYYDFNVFDFEKSTPLKFDLKGDDIFDYYWLDKHQLVLSSQKLPIYWWRQAIFDVDKRKFTYNLSYIDLHYWVISAIKDRPGLFYALFPSEQRNQPEIAIIDVKRNPTNIGGINNSRFNIVDSLSIPRGEFHGCYTDFRGEIRAVALYSEGKRRYHFRQSAKTPWVELPFDPELMNIKAFADDGDVVYVTRRDSASGISSLHRYTVSRAEFGPSLFSDPDYALDQCGLMMSEGNKELLGLRYIRDRTVQVMISPILQDVVTHANQTLPGRSNLITDYDDKLTRFVITSVTDRNVRYFVYDRGLKHFSGLPDPNPSLQSLELRPVQVVHYTTRDGLRLEGYLTLPAGVAGKKPPLIVHPHGGPWVRDYWGFDPEVQFLANRGYAVFQPNYRGSTGYPKAISKDGEFAFRQMHDDVTDGVRQLISSGLVDPQRVAIFGSSFGGYLALCGAAFEPNLYRCAITFAGVFDWKRLIAQRERKTTHDRFNYEFLIERLGDPEKKSRQIRRNFPDQSYQ